MNKRTRRMPWHDMMSSTKEEIFHFSGTTETALQQQVATERSIFPHNLLMCTERAV